MNTRIAVLTILTSAEAGEWTTLDELRGRLGVSRRDVEDAIQDLRLKGRPIIGGAEGVKLSTSPQEIREYAASRRRRLVQVALGTRALLRTARRLDATQPTLGL